MCTRPKQLLVGCLRHGRRLTRIYLSQDPHPGVGRFGSLCYRQDYRWKALSGANTFVTSRYVGVRPGETDASRNILAKA